MGLARGRPAPSGQSVRLPDGPPTDADGWGAAHARGDRCSVDGQHDNYRRTRGIMTRRTHDHRRGHGQAKGPIASATGHEHRQAETDHGCSKQLRRPALSWTTPVRPARGCGGDQLGLLGAAGVLVQQFGAADIEMTRGSPGLIDSYGRVAAQTRHQPCDQNRVLTTGLVVGQGPDCRPSKAVVRTSGHRQRASESPSQNAIRGTHGCRSKPQSGASQHRPNTPQVLSWLRSAAWVVRIGRSSCQTCVHQGVSRCSSTELGPAVPPSDFAAGHLQALEIYQALPWSNRRPIPAQRRWIDLGSRWCGAVLALAATWSEEMQRRQMRRSTSRFASRTPRSNRSNVRSDVAPFRRSHGRACRDPTRTHAELRAFGLCLMSPAMGCRAVVVVMDFAGSMDFRPGTTDPASVIPSLVGRAQGRRVAASTTLAGLEGACTAVRGFASLDLRSRIRHEWTNSKAPAGVKGVSARGTLGLTRDRTSKATNAFVTDPRGLAEAVQEGGQTRSLISSHAVTRLRETCGQGAMP